MKNKRILCLVAGAAVLALISFGVAGCKSSTTPSTSKTFTSNLVNGHTHAMTITQAEVQTPPASGISSDTTSNSGHTHSFDMTQAELQQVNGGTSVTVTTGSSDVGGAHTHTFTITKWF
jgi:hypothetical protein